ncbi:MAG: hypothetical protein WCD86_22460 [Ktedonobacteraceae bacterium]
MRDHRGRMDGYEHAHDEHFHYHGAFVLSSLREEHVLCDLLTSWQNGQNLPLDGAKRCLDFQTG